MLKLVRNDEVIDLATFLLAQRLSDDDPSPSPEQITRMLHEEVARVRPFVGQSILLLSFAVPELRDYYRERPEFEREDSKEIDAQVRNRIRSRLYRKFGFSTE